MSSTGKLSVENKVKQALDKIRPYLQADGGDVQLLEISADLVVKIQLAGACYQCPYQLQTSAGVEEAIKKEVPEIKEVITVQA